MGSGHAICADDFRASVRSKLFHATGTCQTLAYAIVGDHQLLRRYGHFSVATLCKVLTAAIEDDGETKTATNGAVRKILRTMLTRARLATQKQCETHLRERRFQKSPAI